MKRILDKSIIKHLLKKGIEAEDYDKYFCNMDLLFKLDLDEEDFSIINEFIKKWKEDIGITIVNDNTIRVEDDIIKMKFDRNKSTYELDINGNKIRLSKQIVNAICGIYLDMDTAIALYILKDNIDFLKKFDRKKCTASRFVRFKRIDDKMFEMKEYVLIDGKDDKLSVLEDKDSYLIDCKKFNIALTNDECHMLLESDVIISYEEEGQTDKILSGDLLYASNIFLANQKAMNEYSDIEFDEFKYLFNLSDKDMNMFGKNFTDIREETCYESLGDLQSTLVDYVSMQSSIGRLLQDEDFLKYKRLEFRNFSI